METASGISLLNAPPLSVLMDQQLIENENKRADGEKVKTSYIEQQLFAVGCSATAEGLTLYPIDISVHLDTPTAGKFFLSSIERVVTSFLKANRSLKAPRRVSCTIARLSPHRRDEPVQAVEPAAKKPRLSHSQPILRDLAVEVEHFAQLLSEAIID